MKVICRNHEMQEGSFEEKWVKEASWHTSAHVLAQAVKRLYPDTKCAIGPAIAQGFYYDFEFSFSFCAGPHISNVCHIKAFKLLSIAGAYWRGDEKNKMLTRIYGISFPKASELEQYLHQLEEAKLRDHRKLGRELGLFMIFEQGPGFPVFLPKGMIMQRRLPRN